MSKKNKKKANSRNNWGNKDNRGSSKVRKKINLIYIAGTSFSGSTLLGVLIGSSREVFNIGEVKYHYFDNKNNKYCTCGRSFNECEFWRDILYPINKFNCYTMPSFFEKILVTTKIIFFPSKNIYYKTITTDEILLLAQILAKAKKNDKNIDKLVDGSKCIWRLRVLSLIPRINLSVVHIIRKAKFTTKSYKKHGFSYLKSLLSWYLHNFLIKRYIKAQKIPSITVHYEKLCESTIEIIEKLNSFLSTSIKRNYVEEIKAKEFHIIGGNPMRFRHGKSFNNFLGIKNMNYINKDKVINEN